MLLGPGDVLAPGAGLAAAAAAGVPDPAAVLLMLLLVLILWRWVVGGCAADGVGRGGCWRMFEREAVDANVDATRVVVDEMKNRAVEREEIVLPGMRRAGIRAR